MSIVSLIAGLVLLLVGLVNGVATLESLEQVDDFPLYTMTYSGDYEATIETREAFTALPGFADPAVSYVEPELSWGCSLFAAFGDAESALYGRNFDWRFSPALLLFTDRPVVTPRCRWWILRIWVLRARRPMA